jgi:hypothetical protein
MASIFAIQFQLPSSEWQGKNCVTQLQTNSISIWSTSLFPATERFRCSAWTPRQMTPSESGVVARDAAAAFIHTHTPMVTARWGSVRPLTSSWPHSRTEATNPSPIRHQPPFPATITPSYDDMPDYLPDMGTLLAQILGSNISNIPFRQLF